MDEPEYESGYMEFRCPICHANISTDIYYLSYKRNTYDYIITKKELEESKDTFILGHYKNIHGIDVFGGDK